VKSLVIRFASSRDLNSVFILNSFTLLVDIVDLDVFISNAFMGFSIFFRYTVKGPLCPVAY
jgi:hypothetical protein